MVIMMRTLLDACAPPSEQALNQDYAYTCVKNSIATSSISIISVQVWMPALKSAT